MADGNESLEARAERLHRECTVVDISVKGSNWRQLQQGGITGSIVTINAVNTEFIDETMTSIMGYIEAVYAHPNELTIIKSPDEIRAAKAAGKVGYIFHMQGMSEIEKKIYWVEMLARIGVRIMALTYNGANQLGCGCGEPVDTGITYFGKQVVREINRAGVVLDLSHLGPKTARDVLNLSTEPVILSHSCPQALVANPRNAPADIMKAVAESGGIMGISVYAPLLDAGDGTAAPTVETVLDHIDYTIEQLGVEHVCIGSDHSEITDLRWQFYVLRQQDAVPQHYLKPPFLNDYRYHSVQGFDSAASMPKITRGLVARGYSEEDIKMIMGGNMLRVLDQVWGKKVKFEFPSRDTM